MSEAKPRSKPADGIKPGGTPKPRRQKPRDERPRDDEPREKKPSDKKASIVEAAASEIVGEAPPPEAVESDPELTPEQAEQARKKYLLKRFWISGRGYWGRHGDRLGWPLTIGLLILIGINVGFQYGINVWNRSIF